MQSTSSLSLSKSRQVNTTCGVVGHNTTKVLHHGRRESRPTADSSLLSRGDSGTAIVPIREGEEIHALAQQYPTIFTIYTAVSGDHNVQRIIHDATKKALPTISYIQPLALTFSAHVQTSSMHHTKASLSLGDKVRTTFALGGKCAAERHGVICAPQLWKRSVAELYAECNGELELCNNLPHPLGTVVQLPRYLNAMVQMLLKHQALETPGIFRLAAPNEAAPLAMWFDWVNTCNQDEWPEYGDIPHLSPLDFAVLFKRWMASLGDYDRLVPLGGYSEAIQALMMNQPMAHEQELKQALRCILQCLDVQRLSVLACVFHLAQAIIDKCEINLMNADNLATMLAPSLFGFAQVNTADAYDWAIHALVLIFSEKDVAWWFCPVSLEPFVTILPIKQ